MIVPPPFTPPGHKTGKGAIIKATSTVPVQEESAMETDAQPAAVVLPRPPVLKATLARAKELSEPCLVDEAGMRKWSSDMLKGNPGGRAITWEQWGNSFVNQFKGVVDNMAHSLRIKEDSYIKKFAGKEKVVKDSKDDLDRNRYLEDKYSGASLMVSDCKLIKLKKENTFLKEKLAVSYEN